MLVCWDFIDTLEIITRILREVVNRERLCDTNAFYFGHFRNLWGCGLVGWLRELRRTLEIIARILREVVNRERLCGTNAFNFGRFRNLWGRPDLVCLFACSLGFH